MLRWRHLLLLSLFVQLFTGAGPALAVGASPSDPALTPDAPGVVKGVVQNAEADTPLPGANVAVRRAADSTLVDGTWNPTAASAHSPRGRTPSSAVP